jgi:hypothetical protein
VRFDGFFGPFGWSTRFPHRRQQLARILVIPAPQQSRALRGEPVGLVGRDPVVDDLTFFGGGAPRSERQRAVRASPSSLQ